MITEQNIFSKNKNEVWEATQGKLNQNKPISILSLHNLLLEKDEKALFWQQKTQPLAPSLYLTGNAGIFNHVSKVAIQKQSLIFIIKMTKDAYGTISITAPIKKDNYICLDQ